MNAQYIRNIILAAHATHDHIVHSYQPSSLDWVDITSALKADPAKASAMLNGVSSLAPEQRRRGHQGSEQDQDLVASGQLAHIFAQRLLGHPAMQLPPEVNLIAVAHYLQALECQRDANRVVGAVGR
ncbi:nickel-dependent hydrogenase large subunit [Shigella flexneri]